MKLHYQKEHTSCMNYKTDAYKGFGLEKLIAGNVFDNSSTSIKSNFLVFILEGELEVQMQNDKPLWVRPGEFFFIPFTATYKITTIKSGACIYHNFFYNNIKLCDSHMLNSYLSEGIVYDRQFRAFKENDLLRGFLRGLEYYLQLGINCRHLHALKEKELMIIFRTTYSKEEVLGLFHPILGRNVQFKESVLMLSDTVFNRTDLAAHLGMSVSDLARKFKEEFNESVHSWILKHRNKRILEQAAFPTTTVKQLIYDFDFSSAANFNRYCKQHFGCTPTDLVEKKRIQYIENKQNNNI